MPGRCRGGCERGRAVDPRAAPRLDALDLASPDGFGAGFPRPVFAVRRREPARRPGAQPRLDAGISHPEMRFVREALPSRCVEVERADPVAWMRSNAHTRMRPLPVRSRRATGRPHSRAGAGPIPSAMRSIW